MNFKSNFINILNSRGFIQDSTDFEGLDSYFKDGENSDNPAVVYIGFDCTAKSLHAGSLMQIMVLRWLQKSGHKPLVLLGGGTTKIGDPSGKDESRKILSDEQIEENKRGIKKVFEKYLEFEDCFNSNTNKAFVVDNFEWLEKLNYINFLREVGRHFSVNRMLSFDSVKLRLERQQELSFLEFNYMILQAYDFVELADKYGCRVQIGGSDQWGNIVNGTELHRRLNAEFKSPENSKKIFGLTTPLLTTSSGTKMGKTADGAVWLDETLLKPYDFWQYFRNISDSDVGKFLRLFTELTISEIEKLEKLSGNEINSAKIVLANEVTRICHGEISAKEAEITARNLFEKGIAGGDLPTFFIEKSRLELGIQAYSLLKETLLSDSNNEARKLIKGGGVKVNDIKITEENLLIDLNYLRENEIKLSVGKKKHAIIKLK